MRQRHVGLLAGLIACVALLSGAGPAAAHPLGNFTINHLSQVAISTNAIDVHYILDQAEIPTFQERDLSPAVVLQNKRTAIARGLALIVDGRRVALTPTSAGQLTKPPGQGGLPLTRVELDLHAAIPTAHRVQLRDNTFWGRIGWKAIVIKPGHGTAVRSDAYTGDPTGGLRRYPTALLQSPLDRRSASFDVRPGAGTVSAPTGPLASTAGGSTSRSGDGFASVFSRATGGGVLLFLLLASFGWGALHALSPGHGKAMVAAYLVGTRGTPRHALALGAIVTITHTIGVFALGFITLALSQYVLPEQLYPWLTLASGLLVVAIGVMALRSRIGTWRQRTTPNGSSATAAHSHRHEHAHAHDAGVAHDHGHGSHGHSHLPSDLTWRGLLGMGVSAGIIPCPSALVVLLAALSQHRIGLGLVLIVAFSLGLAMTLMALGMLVIYAGRLTERVRFSGRWAAALPAVSALVIVAVGSALTIRAIPRLV